MSYCKEEGKDRIIFVTKEDHEEPSNAPKSLLEDDDDEPGLIMPDGSINWNCPCLGGMASGPCGPEFREAFSCFHYSTTDPKGADCYEQFREMQECMSGYPALYKTDDDDQDDTEDIFSEESEKDKKQNEALETSKPHTEVTNSAKESTESKS